MQQEYAQRLQSASTTLLGVMNNVLDFSKIEAGELKADAQPFDVLATVDSAVGLFQPQLRDSTVRLRLEIAPEVPRLISADGLRLHQVLVNLVGNAVKFTEEGEVRVSVQCRDAQTSAPVLCIVVSDTGIGIEASQIERIFAPFAQADGSITRRFGGTGLGLSISRRLAELMGGTLSVRSTPGYGAEFTLQVPFSPVEQAPPGGTPHPAPSPESNRITAAGPTAAGPTTVAPELAAAPPAVPQRQADLVVLQPLLAELDDLLSRNMLSARGVAEQVRAELQGTAWAEGFSDIEQDVSRLRFPAARARLASLRAQWAEASSGPETTASA